MSAIAPISLGLAAAERGLLPDGVVRAGIRRLLARRLRALEGRARPAAFAESLSRGPLALVPEKANEQHYEVPAAFYEIVLGRHMKYSSGYWAAGTKDLDGAERAMLDLTAERAGVRDGERILELGCGWGSLSLDLAKRFPNARILAVSNSRGQREHVEARKPGNLEVRTADMNAFDPGLERFDRVVSVEMFEHMRNWRELFARVARWLRPGGRAFVHVFCHRRHAYPFETAGADDWLGRHFFTGGMMPSLSLPDEFREDLVVEERWEVPGTHYARTAEAWLANLDRRRAEATAVLARAPGETDARTAFRRWRLFFLACAELFAYRGGNEWLVGHYRLRRRGA